MPYGVADPNHVSRGPTPARLSFLAFGPHLTDNLTWPPSVKGDATCIDVHLSGYNDAVGSDLREVETTRAVSMFRHDGFRPTLNFAPSFPLVSTCETIDARMIIALIGVTGSGKTTVGKMLAAGLGWKY